MTGFLRSRTCQNLRSLGMFTSNQCLLSAETGLSGLAGGAFRGNGWWAGGPRKKNEKKRPKFIRVGESLYRVSNYRLAYRRFYGCDVPEREQYDFANRQRYAVEASKEKHQRKGSSSPVHSKNRPAGVTIYPYEKR
eukprot:TRINITY_DN10677_c0_g1_i1.p1 TRINITY_DN10677_c0_g1~~TRINITY_DN10677_c0_g1_i1.p1  ORF type:complete len:154 (-),score=17.16 TRINITY_DN10677_c0_g1_i1:74-481(-)